MASPEIPSTMLPQVTFDLAAGPLLIEVSVGLLLAGIMIAQFYFYWSKYEADSTWMKCLVYAVCILELVHTAFTIHIQYSYFVVDVRNPLAVAHIVWSGGAILILEMLIVSLVQGFYTYRIWQLSHSYVAVIIPAVTLFARCVFGLVTASFTYIYSLLEVFATKTNVVATVNVGLTLAVVMDLLTTAILIYYLKQQETQVRRTRHIIQTLMFYTVNTGAMTSVFSMLVLFTFNFVQSSFMFAGFVIIVTKVYANSMLAMLNARKKLKEGRGSLVHSIPMTARNSVKRQLPSVTQDGVHVEICRETIHDPDRYLGHSLSDTEEVTKSSYTLV